MTGHGDQKQLTNTKENGPNSNPPEINPTPELTELTKSNEDLTNLTEISKSPVRTPSPECPQIDLNIFNQNLRKEKLKINLDDYQSSDSDQSDESSGSGSDRSDHSRSRSTSPSSNSKSDSDEDFSFKVKNADNTCNQNQNKLSLVRPRSRPSRKSDESSDPSSDENTTNTLRQSEINSNVKYRKKPSSTDVLLEKLTKSLIIESEEILNERESMLSGNLSSEKKKPLKTIEKPTNTREASKNTPNFRVKAGDLQLPGRQKVTHCSIGCNINGNTGCNSGANLGKNLSQNLSGNQGNAPSNSNNNASSNGTIIDINTDRDRDNNRSSVSSLTPTEDYFPSTIDQPSTECPYQKFLSDSNSHSPVLRQQCCRSMVKALEIVSNDIQKISLEPMLKKAKRQFLQFCQTIRNLTGDSEPMVRAEAINRLGLILPHIKGLVFDLN